MRKIVVLLAVAVLGSAIAFAQDAAAPTFALSGYVGAGVRYQSTADSLALYDANNGSAGLRVSINGVLDGGAYGLKWGFATNDVTSGFPGNLGPNDTLGWFYAGDKLLKFSLGKVDDGAYSTFVDGDFSWDGAVGFALDIAPIPGLSIGYFLPVSTTGAALATDFKTSQIAASFTADKVVAIKAGIDLKGLDTTVGENFWAGFNLLAVDNLTLMADLELKGLGLSAGSITDIWEKAGYSFSPVSISVMGRETLDSSTATTNSNNIEVNPSVSVGLGGPTVGVSIDLNTHSGNSALGFTWNVNPTFTLPVAKNTILMGLNVGDNGAGGTAGTTGADVYVTYEMNF